MKSKCPLCPRLCARLDYHVLLKRPLIQSILIIHTKVLLTFIEKEGHGNRTRFFKLTFLDGFLLPTWRKHSGFPGSSWHHGLILKKDDLELYQLTVTVTIIATI